MNLKSDNPTLPLPPCVVSLDGPPHFALALHPPVFFVTHYGLGSDRLTMQRWAWGLTSETAAWQMQVLAELDEYALQTISELRAAASGVAHETVFPPRPHPRSFLVTSPTLSWFGAITVGKLGWGLSGGIRDAGGKFPARICAGATKELAHMVGRDWEQARRNDRFHA